MFTLNDLLLELLRLCIDRHGVKRVRERGTLILRQLRERRGSRIVHRRSTCRTEPSERYNHDHHTSRILLYVRMHFTAIRL